MVNSKCAKSTWRKTYLIRISYVGILSAVAAFFMVIVLVALVLVLIMWGYRQSKKGNSFSWRLFFFPVSPL